MAKIERLTPEQEAMLPEWAERWRRIGVCCEPANRGEAERGVVEAYRIAGLSAPRIAWCGSPLSMALTRAIVREFYAADPGDTVAASVRDRVGASLWTSVTGHVMAGVRDSIRDILVDSIGDSVRNNVIESVGASVASSVVASVGASVRDILWAISWAHAQAGLQATVADSVWVSIRDSIVDSVGASVRDSVRDSVGDSVGDSVRDSVWAGVAASVAASIRNGVRDSGYGQHDANWIAFYAYFRDVLGLVAETDKLTGLRLLTENAGWFLPHEHICWISERTCRVKQDARWRLHCEDGPAVAYPDGWTLYYWHGIRVAPEIIERPETITVAAIDAERNAEVRRVMMNRYGMARYLRDTGAEEIDRDRDSKGERVLYRKRDGLGVIKMIRLENSTPDALGDRKDYWFRVPPEVTSCRAAVAWMYSLDKPERYAPAVET
jgi:hypothetical protein